MSTPFSTTVKRSFGTPRLVNGGIARALGTSHTTIYRHFRSKADI
ncbi:MAG TPA: TetR/AcrR family transcriptional regulator, partial [Planctomycetes bacterium]|nr:TetR/AcrR family transcriptional regulator [Planctomycetota bacterium]